jgi:uncharacterized protein YjbI with pentapeptide repeats
MKILKPDSLAVHSQPLEKKGKMHHAFTVTSAFHLLTQEALPANDALGIALATLSDGEILDCAVPKVQAEWLLAGSACADRPVERMIVRASVGKSERRLLIHGEKTLSGTQAFLRMPLTWQNTWGSPQHPENPLSCGLVTEKSGYTKEPTVQDGNAPHGSPACMSAMGAWPCRMKNMGTYDAQWLKTRFPALPDDADEHFYNLAQEAQRMGAHLNGGEKIVLEGLHTEKSRIESQLCLAQFPFEIQRTHSTEWEQCALIPDTLWLFPNDLLGIVLWHALVPCADEAANDIAFVRLLLPEAIPAPAPEAPQGMSTAAKVAAGMAGAGLVGAGIAAATANKAEKSNVAAEQKKPTAPQKDSAPVQPEKASSTSPAMRQVFQENLPEINAALAEQGIPPLTAAHIADVEKRLDAAGAFIEEAKAQLQAPLPDLAQLLAEKDVPPEQIAAVQKALAMQPPMPADFSDNTAWLAASAAYQAELAALIRPAPALAENFAKALSLLGSQGTLAAQAMLPPMPSSLEQALLKADIPPQQVAGLCRALQQDPPMDQGFSGLMGYAKMIEQEAGIPDGGISERIKKAHDFMVQIKAIEPEPAMAQPESIAPLPLAQEKQEPDSTLTPNNTEQGAAQQAQAQAQSHEPATAAPASPQKEQPLPQNNTAAQAGSASEKKQGDIALVAGILAAAGTLAGANLANKSLAYMDVSGQDFSNANLENADLTETNFSTCLMKNANIKNAHAPRSQWVQANLTQADLSGIQAQDADFEKALLNKSNFSAAKLEGANFYQVQGSAASFCHAHLERNNFMEANLPELDCRGIQAKRLIFDKAHLPNAQFAQATCLEMACEGASFPHADFHQAALQDCAWEKVDAHHGRFDGANLQGARMQDCTLSQAVLCNAAASGANFDRSLLEECDMRFSNFFQASLREALVLNAVLDNANCYGADMHRVDISTAASTQNVDFTATIIDARRKTS